MNRAARRHLLDVSKRMGSVIPRSRPCGPCEGTGIRCRPEMLPLIRARDGRTIGGHYGFASRSCAKCNGWGALPGFGKRGQK